MSVTVGGQMFYTKLPDSQRRKDDSLDIAIVNLHPDIADLLKKSGQHFLKFDQIQTGINLSKGDVY